MPMHLPPTRSINVVSILYSAESTRIEGLEFPITSIVRTVQSVLPTWSKEFLLLLFFSFDCRNQYATLSSTGPAGGKER